GSYPLKCRLHLSTRVTVSFASTWRSTTLANARFHASVGLILLAQKSNTSGATKGCNRRENEKVCCELTKQYLTCFLKSGLLYTCIYNRNQYTWQNLTYTCPSISYTDSLSNAGPCQAIGQ